MEPPGPHVEAGWIDLPLLPLFPEASRAAGLQRLDGFLPRAGAAYARDRNHDRGAAVVRGNVSMLSPLLRHCLVSEAEVIAAAAWADATPGYFRFRKGLPSLVELALSGGAEELCLTDESRR